MNLPRYALRHRSVVIAATILALGLGLVGFGRMPRYEDPEVTVPKAVVVTRWPGVSAERVEALLTEPLEDAIADLPGVKKLTSESRTGLSHILVEISAGFADIEQVWDALRVRVARVRPRLPAGCWTPWVDSDFADVYAVCLTLYQVPPAGAATIERPYGMRRLEQFAETVRDALRQVRAVARVQIHGTQAELIEVEVSPGEWGRIALDTRRLSALLEARNIVAAGGMVETPWGRIPVSPSGALEAVPELDDVIVHRRADDGLPVRLSDLPVRIRRTLDAPPQRLVRYRSGRHEGGRRALMLAISMSSGDNVVQLGRDVEAVVTRLRAAGRVPPDVEITRVNDLPRQVDERIRHFGGSLLQGGLLVLVLALIMLGARAALVMTASIPITLVATFAVLRWFDVSLDQTSIASLIIALGMLVDNALVVSDNTVRLLGEGRSPVEAAIAGAHELAIPLLASTLTTVGAFLPMLTIPDQAGEYVRSVPIVVSTTLLVSLLVALTVTPLMCRAVLRPPRDRGPRGDRLPRRVYRGVARCCVRFWPLTLGLSAAGLVAALALLPRIGTQFFPKAHRDQLFIKVWLPEGASVEATDRVCRQVEQRLVATGKDDAGQPLYVDSTTFVGFGGVRMILSLAPEPERSSYGFIVVNTAGPAQTNAWIGPLRAACADIAGAQIEVRRLALGPPVRYPVEYRLSGPDPTVLRAAAERMVDRMRRTPGLLNAHHDWRNLTYHVDVEVDAEAANLAGVTHADVARTLHGLLSGIPLTTYREGSHAVRVVLRARQQDRTGLDLLSRAHVQGRAGKIPLATVSRVAPTWRPAVIARRNHVRTITVAGLVADGHNANRTMRRLRPELERAVAGLPPEYVLADGGSKAETAESQGDILAALVLGYVLIVVVLILQYNSFVKPLVILATLPLALIGALLGLFLTGWPLGFTAALGVVSLGGVVINNAIILIDFIEANLRAGMALAEAVVEAGSARMTPILLTTATTVGGLLPLALGGGPLFEPMAIVMIFGLLVSTLLTLLVIPTAYACMARWSGA